MLCSCHLHFENEYVLLCAPKLNVIPDRFGTVANNSVLNLIVDTEHNVRALNSVFAYDGVCFRTRKIQMSLFKGNLKGH